jgi:hypothetical protein
MFIRRSIEALALLLLISVSASAEPGFTKLVTGDALDGWHNPYEWGQAQVVDGEVRLKANRKFFLTTDKEYGDFVFKCEVKMPNGTGNSGIMFRAHEKTNRVWGYQAEVDPSDRQWAGGLYDEGRRGWLNPLKDKKKKNAFNPKGWNQYKIKCVGDRIQIWVNGVKTTDYRDPVDIAGHIALQHHGENGKVYRFRNIEIKDLGRHEWQPIFNGKNLSGWQPKGGGDWQVKDGVLIGTMEQSENAHGILMSEQAYSDFTARVRFKTVEGNSGFYFRSEPVDSGVILHGVQAEVAPSYMTGGLYETGGRAWVVQSGKKTLKGSYKPGQWTTLTVSAHGQEVVTHVNGKKAAQTDKAGREKGYFGLQLHGGQNMDVRFKRIELLRPAN